ncbi:MAG: Uma2 family endonuclease [Chloroflexota bacterium]
MAIEEKARLMSAEDLLCFTGDPAKRYELADGEVIEMSPPGGEHGKVTMGAGALVFGFARQRQLGTVYAAETGFLIQRSPDRVRAPDVAFVARDRLPEGHSPPGYVPLAPDFVVEVVSPNDSALDVQARVDEWLKAGTQIAWTVYPGIRTVLVFRGLGQIERKSADDDELDAEPVLPGFRCKVRDLFPEG